MKRVVSSFALGGLIILAIQIAIWALDRPGEDRLFPDCLFRVGVWISIFAPDSDFYASHPAGPISVFVLYAANIALYSGLAFVVLWLIGLMRHPRA